MVRRHAWAGGGALPRWRTDELDRGDLHIDTRRCLKWEFFVADSIKSQRVVRLLHGAGENTVFSSMLRSLLFTCFPGSGTPANYMLHP